MTAKIVLRKKLLTNGEYPVCIRLSNKNQSATYIRIEGLSCLEKEWSKDISRFKRNKLDYKELNSILNDTEIKIDSIMVRLLAKGIATYSKFKEDYNFKSSNNEVLPFWKSYIEELAEQKRYGTNKSYLVAYNKFEKFAKANTEFEDINFALVDSFRTHLLKGGVTKNSASTYIVGLRAIYNRYHKLKSLPKKEIDWQISFDETKNRHLTLEELRKFIKFDSGDSSLMFAKDMFLFSFYADGMNFSDMTMLTRSNIREGRIIYKRNKTNRTYSININDKLKEIILKYNYNGKYLLPLRNEKVANSRNDISVRITTTNNQLARISKELNLPKITTYTARYTVAGLHQQSEAPIERIAEILGHSDVKTTKIYLAKLTNTQLDETRDSLYSLI
jgi:integrase/recombinase XerD